MIAFLISSIKIISVLGFLILIHEGGHFLVARLCKVSVNEFSIGFGPIIWKKQGKTTRYTLRLIPLGGFVNLEGEEERSSKEGSFSQASIPKRMAIILAGGIVNIIFAVLVYFTLMASMGDYTSLQVESLMPEGAAAQAGVQEQDKILTINDRTIYTKSDIDTILAKSKGEKLKITLLREGNQEEILVTPSKQEYKNTGIYLKALETGESTKIVTVAANSNAEKEGLQANDEIVKINGKEVKNQEEIITAINESQTEELTFFLKRGQEEIEITLIPEMATNYYLGIYFAKAENTIANRFYYATFETIDFTFSIFENLKMLIAGEVRVNQFMGPVGISEVVVNTNTITDFVSILALISLSLGVTNLLPIPALDGGKFLLLVIEAIRKKKISERVEINIQLIGFALLITLSIYITYHDILRIL